MASGGEKWQWKLCRMANQYCIYAWWGDSIAHLPAQQGLRRYVPVDFREKIMNLSLFRATKTEKSIVMGENWESWKALLNNYHLSDSVSSVTPSDSECLSTKQTWFIDLLSLLVHVHFLNKVNIHFICTFLWLWNTDTQCYLSYSFCLIDKLRGFFL